ncbi:MAG: hypothetical protein K0U38_00255 [Epsilonproteobacteria bacterium]|nr:hypothetical protein [Campylobacterota bacterium]
MIRSIILSLGLLIMVGCGAQSNPTSEDSGTASETANTLDPVDNNLTIAGTPEPETVEPTPAPTVTPTETSVEEEESILPRTISMDFPDVLKQTARIDENSSLENSETTDNNQTDTNQSVTKTNDLGYEQLKEDISEVEDVVKIAQVNLVVLEKVMPEVLDRCEGMLSCLFEEKALSIIMDNRTISSIATIVEDHNFTFMDVNSTISLGEVGFNKYDTNRSYQYELTLDMLASGFKTKSDVLKEFQTFKWSDDSKDVVTSYIYEDNESTSSVSLHYLTNDDGKETMHVYDTEDNKTAGLKENTSLILSSEGDENSSFNLTSNSILKHSIGDETNTSSFSSNVEISDDTSLLLFSGSISEESSDQEVASTSEIICDNNMSCDEKEDNLSVSIEDIELYELSIVGGDLKEGDYILLAPNTNLEAVSLIDVFELSLGSFTVFEDKKQGALHSDAFLYMLNDLTIVYIDKALDTAELFEIVAKQDKPTLRIVKY